MKAPIRLLLLLALAVSAWGVLLSLETASAEETPPALRVLPGPLYYQDETANVQIALEPGEHQISALIFSIAFDANRLQVPDPTQVEFTLQGGVSGAASLSPDRNDILRVVIFSVGNVVLPSGSLVQIPFKPVCQSGQGGYSTEVKFAVNPPLSFGAPSGMQIPGSGAGNRVTIICRNAPPTPTPTATPTIPPDATPTPTVTPTAMPTGGPSGTAGDADGDGLSDRTECPGGIPCPDLDQDGVSDPYESNLDDFDGDGIPDYQDPDDDGDTIPTIAENPDPDGDGVPLDAQNSDGDQHPDYLDVDDDNDSVWTIYEVARSRAAEAGRDSDADGSPDYLDTDDDGDLVPTAAELPDRNGDGNPDDGQDSDGDRIADYRDSDDDNDRVATRREDVNADGDPRNDDTDADGTPNYLDVDDDGDRIHTVDEDPDQNRSPLNDDTDGDGIPNYLDADDDNDGVPTDAEGPYDEQGDGTPDYLDPATIGKWHVWLAFVQQQATLVSGTEAPLPDLTITRLWVENGAIYVTIMNQGLAEVNSGFWVDLYINPVSSPVHVNQRWDNVGAMGVAWGVGGAGLPLQPGTSLTLTLGDQYYSPGRSNFSGVLPAAAQLYAQVDSYHADFSYGNVFERDEQPGVEYNNIFGPTTGP